MSRVSKNRSIDIIITKVCCYLALSTSRYWFVKEQNSAPEIIVFFCIRSNPPAKVYAINNARYILKTSRTSAGGNNLYTYVLSDVKCHLKPLLQ